MMCASWFRTVRLMRVTMKRVPIRSLGIAAEMIFNFLGGINTDTAKDT